MPTEYELIHSSLSCRGEEGLKELQLVPQDKTRSHYKTPSLYWSSHRSRGARLQYNITGRSHRRLGTHLCEEHSAAGSRDPRWPPQGRRQVAGGEKAQ